MKKLTQRGQHIVLPIVGNILSELAFRVDRCPILVFRDTEGECELQIEDQIVLVSRSAEELLPHAKPGPTFDPKRLGRLLDLLGLTVDDALARKDGSLQIVFAGGLALKVTSTTGHEAWHFHLPRPGRPALGGHQISVHGAAGHLLTFGAEGTA